MKHHRILQALFLMGAGFSGLNAQETVTKWDVEIPAPITDGTPSPPPPKPEPIDFKVVSSRTTRMDVTKAPEMPDLPPITGTINVTVQLVDNPGLIDPPPPLPTLPPEDPAVIARLAELRENYRGTQLVFLSATVYDNNRTFLRIYPNGRADGSVTAWSNLDFHHFSGFSTYRVKDAEDGTLYDYRLLMGIGGIDTRRWKEIAEARGIEYKGPEIPEIPGMPDLADGGPAFVLVEGDAKSAAMDTLEQIHDLYRKEGTRMEAAYHARVKAHAERKAYLLANPPKPNDVTIQFWKRDHPSPRGVQALEGGTTMKRQLIQYGLLILAGTSLSNANPQPQISFTEGVSGTWNTDWSGVALRTYFIEWSLDLENWHYAPLVEFGTGLKSFGINTQGEAKFFVRLHYVDDTGVTTLQQARDADFDNDGIPNYYEVENLFSDPLDKDSAGGDSDMDGMPDGWELFHFGSLGATPGAIGFPLPSGDGLTNKEKADLGLNPNTDYSASTAGQPATYAYDSVGRLTGVTAPVGAGDYTPDEEGNILNAQ